MKCPQCQVDNKDQAKLCRKCGANLQIPPLWQPTWAWHARTLGIIYAILIVLFFVTKALLKPYVRQLPAESTPWLYPDKVAHAVK
jgi:hypothetical protein